jgi:Fe(3+) dicitrate transport protein
LWLNAACVLFFSETVVLNFSPAAYALSFAVCFSVQPAFAEDDLKVETAADKNVALDNVYITGGKDEILRQPGSATLIDNVALEAFEYTDLHRILNAVPGVNIQEEDGYGLRPNIGLRGTSPERSKKITVMEDGILSGPAPYSAPAAYYFPNMSRMNAVEVFKGPSVIQYGPATVGGAINLVSREIPYDSTGELDVQYGTDNFQRYNVYQGQQIDQFGYVIEGLKVSADGFKNIDGTNDDSGFERNDINLKTSWQILGDVSQLLLFKVGYADEEANETYLGLSRDDFENDPYRRYAASSLDKSEWTHEQFQFTHQLEVDDFVVTTDVYRNNFDRDWFKVNGFNTQSVTIDEVLSDPATQAVYYNVLNGDASSVGTDQQLRIGNNRRKFFSQGIQTRVNDSYNFLGFRNDIEVGIRVHQDQVKRHHTEQNYNMLVGGDLEVVDGTFKTTDRNTNDALAVAVYVQNKIKIEDTVVSLGLRHENIESSKTIYGELTGIKESKNTLQQSVWLPGIGVYSQLTEEVGILAGVYKGFTAATPGASDDVNPEKSTNFELGSRFSGAWAFAGQAEVIAFVNNYSEFSGTCSFAQGSCDTSNTGEQSNAGSAVVYGLEAGWNRQLIMGGFTMPFSSTYTYSHGEFGDDFVDSSGAFGETGQAIETGYEISYLPEHRLNVQAGIGRNDWKLNTSVLYQSEMRNVPGEGSIDRNDLIEAHTIIDLSASYQYTRMLQFYGTIDNVLNEQYVAGVKPYGFRPGKPRSINVGAKYSF